MSHAALSGQINGPRQIILTHIRSTKTSNFFLNGLHFGRNLSKLWENC